MQGSSKELLVDFNNCFEFFSYSVSGGLSLVVRLGIENFCYSIELEQWYLSTFCMSSGIIVYSGSSGNFVSKFDFSCN